MNLILNYAIKIIGPVLVEKLVQALLTSLQEFMAERAIESGAEIDMERDTERYYMLRAIANAETNEERKTLSVALAKLHRMEKNETTS